MFHVYISTYDLVFAFFKYLGMWFIDAGRKKAGNSVDYANCELTFISRVVIILKIHYLPYKAFSPNVFLDVQNFWQFYQQLNLDTDGAYRGENLV